MSAHGADAKDEPLLPRVVIDRNATCPFLLRLFWTLGQHNRAAAYDLGRRLMPRNELHVYSWPDATLVELSALVRGALRRRGRRSEAADAEGRARALHFMLVCPDPDYRGRSRAGNGGGNSAVLMRELGTVTCDDEAAVEATEEGTRGAAGEAVAKPSSASTTTLAQLGFQGGDFMDVLLR